MRVLFVCGMVCVILLLAFTSWAQDSVSRLNSSLMIDLEHADLTLLGEDNGDWNAYFASPAGDVNGDGLGDVLVGAPMAGNKICPFPTEPDGSCPGLLKGEGVGYLVLGRPQEEWLPSPVNLAQADASFLGCEVTSMTARQLYTAGDVNGDGYDDILISGWKCGENYTGKAYLILGRPDVDHWGRFFPVEQSDASFLGEHEMDFLSYYVSTAGDVNGDGLDDILITATHYEVDAPCTPHAREENCGEISRSFLKSSELFDPATENWTPAGDMMVSRIYHTATLLSSGKLLVAGGQNNNRYLDTAELFDRFAETWTKTGNLNTARSGHIAALLLDDKVLVAGGRNETGFLDSAELYDRVKGVWTTTGSMNTGRSGHVSVLLPDGKLLVAGGEDETGVLNSTELFDPGTGSWATTDSMNTGRSGHTAVSLPDGTVLVVGGQNEGGFLSSVELFDPGTETWTTTGSLTVPRSGHTATLLSDGTVLVAGGKNDSGFLRSSELFDPTTETWTSSDDLYGYRTDHTATLLDDGTVVVAGGQNDGGSQRSSESFDPVTASWTTAFTDTLNVRRTDHVSALLPDGRVILAGGRNATNFGKTYLILGREAADWGTDYPVAEADASFLGEDVEDRLGRATTGVGDVNGDGYDDFIIGAISSDDNGEDAGENYLFLGRDENDPSWWGSEYPVAAADASFLGEAEGDESGRRVAWAGDVNGDGYSDFLIGSALNDQTDYDAGIAHLILGRPEADWGLEYRLVDADASFVGEARRDQAGRRLNGAGDVNNDGYDDFLIGAPHNEQGSEFPDVTAGAAYLIYGRPEADWGRYFSLAQADIIFIGKPDVGVAGYDMAWLGDFDGDNIDDYLIAAYGGRNNEAVPGESYVMLGSAAPVPVQFMPDNPTGLANKWQRFTGDYWEPNGTEDFSSAELFLDAPGDDSMDVRVRYDLAANELYIYGNDGSGWVGPCTPGDSVRLSSGSAELDCRGSNGSSSGLRTMRVMWRLRWNQMPSQSLNFAVKLRAADASENDSGFVDVATWTLMGPNLFLPLIAR